MIQVRLQSLSAVSVDRGCQPPTPDGRTLYIAEVGSMPVFWALQGRVDGRRSAE